jgi:hypothetical protein
MTVLSIATCGGSAAPQGARGGLGDAYGAGLIAELETTRNGIIRACVAGGGAPTRLTRAGHVSPCSDPLRLA